VSEGAELPPPTVEAPAAAPAPAVTPPHQRHFKIFNAVLICLAIFAVSGAAAILVSSGGSSATETDSWSAFKPSNPKVAVGAPEIAAHVGPKYRLPAGQQMVLVTGGPLEIEGLPVRIAIRHSAAAGGGVDLLDGGGALYRLCGLGPKCSIASGKPSKERGLLLYREALELALYSFHELRDVDHVVVFMPPSPEAKADTPTIALHYRRDDVAGQLVRPLRATLPTPVPTPDTIDQSPDTPFVRQLTLGNVFSFSFTQANQDTSVFLILDPPPADS
jgi:hypothetical protein